MKSLLAFCKAFSWSPFHEGDAFAGGALRNNLASCVVFDCAPDSGSAFEVALVAVSIAQNAEGVNCKSGRRKGS